MQKLLEVAQFKAIRGNLILVIIASYTLILELVNRSRYQRWTLFLEKNDFEWGCYALSKFARQQG